jgi:K+-transporting ATPase ATPase C chain
MIIWRQLRIAVVVLVVFSVIAGIIYPLVVTGIAQAAFHHQANGSLIESDGQPLGSDLIGQPFSDPKYFWGRLSATKPVPYSADASAGSNYGPLNPALRQAIEERIADLRAVDPENTDPVPIDLVTFSASGLDPHISVAAASYQAARVARYRDLSMDQVMALIRRYTSGRQLGFLGEQRVNVLELNLALDGME